MAIKDVPETYDAMAAFLDAYEADHFAYSDGGHRVAMANRDRMAREYFPRLPRAMAADLVDAFVPEYVRRTLRLPRPSAFARVAVGTALRARRLTGRFLPRRGKPIDFLAPSAARSYPGGYEIDGLGPAGPSPRCPVKH